MLRMLFFFGLPFFMYPEKKYMGPGETNASLCFVSNATAKLNKIMWTNQLKDLVWSRISVRKMWRRIFGIFSSSPRQIGQRQFHSSGFLKIKNELSKSRLLQANGNPNPNIQTWLKTLTAIYSRRYWVWRGWVCPSAARVRGAGGAGAGDTDQGGYCGWTGRSSPGS